MESIDRLSALPEDVLCHILSFLPTKFAVTTSVLARRWRFVWTGVPILDLDSKNHRLEMFQSIIYRVMMQQRAKSMTTFRLWYRRDTVNHSNSYCSPFDVETWIATAIARNVKIIHLWLDGVSLPRCLFTCKTLVALGLPCYVDIAMACAVHLPSLKKLYLYSIDSGESFPHLLSGCPVLEELLVEKMVIANSGVCRISSSTIKRLAIIFQSLSFSPIKVEINAPALGYLKMAGNCVFELMFTETLNNLIEVGISSNNCVAGSDYQYSVSVSEFLDYLPNLKFLRLSSNFVEVDEKLEHWSEPERVPTCLLSHLTTVIFDEFCCDELELELVKYLLKNSKVLKTMIIYSKHCTEEAFRKIGRFPRGSEEWMETQNLYEQLNSSLALLVNSLVNS